MRVEEILISSVPSDFVEEDLSETRVSTMTLGQSDRMRLSTFAFELFNRRLLRVSRQATFRTCREYELDIGILDPKPERSLKISRFYLSAFVITAVTAGLERFSDLIPHAAMLPVLLAAGAGIGLSLILAAYRSHDHLVFHSQYGRVPLVVLLNNKPDRKTFNTFIDALTKYIDDAKGNLASRSDGLSQELKELRRLTEKGVISDKRYECIKRHILGLHN